VSVASFIESLKTELAQEAMSFSDGLMKFLF